MEQHRLGSIQQNSRTMDIKFQNSQANLIIRDEHTGQELGITVNRSDLEKIIGTEPADDGWKVCDYKTYTKACAENVPSRGEYDGADWTYYIRKPALPTEPGSLIKAKKVRGFSHPGGGTWDLILGADGAGWFSGCRIEGASWHYEDDIEDWTA